MTQFRGTSAETVSRLVTLTAFLLMTTLAVACGEDEVTEQETPDDEYTVGGTVEGLDGEGLVLQLNGEQDLLISSDGPFEFSTALSDGDDYEVTVYATPSEQSCFVENDSGTIDGADVDDVDVHCETLDSEDPAHFAIEIDRGASELEVDVGEPVVVVAEIENTGDETDSQAVELAIGGEIADSTEIELGVSESDAVTLQWETTEEDTGLYDAVVSTDDDSDSAPVTVGDPVVDPAYFAVSIDVESSTLDVEEQETVTVVADIENIGEESATQDVVLRTDDELRDTVEDVELDRGDAQTVTLQWETEIGDAGDYTAEVETDDDADSATGTVSEYPEPAFFAVSIDETDSTLDVEEGELVVVEAAVENTGDETATRDITLEIDGIQQDEITSLELDAGEAQTLALQWQTEIGDAGDYTAEVDTGDDTDTANGTVSEYVEPAFFSVSIDESESTLDVEEGDTVTVVADVENTGDETATQDVTLLIDGETEDEVEDVELEGGSSQAVTLQWQTEIGDAGDYTAEVDTDDDTDSVTGTVSDYLEPAFFAVSIDETDSTLDVEEGELVVVEAAVENTGDETATRDITLEIDGIQQDEITSLELDGGESQTLALHWQTEIGDAGDYTAEVDTGDDTDTANGTVSEYVEPAFFSVSIDAGSSSLNVDEGEMVTVVVDVENTGDETATQDITLQIDGDVEDIEEDLELDGGASQTVTLQWQTEAGDSGSYTAEVTSDDDSDSANVTVDQDLDPAFFAVSIDSAASTLDVEEGDTVTVVAEVENTGDETGTQDIVLDIDGTVEDTASDISIAGGSTETVELQWETEIGDEGDYTAEVASDDDSDTATGTVSEYVEPAFFAVSIDETASTLDVEEGETVTVVADVENTGDEIATQDITLLIDGEIEDEEADVELDGGSSQTVTLQWETEIGDAGDYTAEVASDDDTDTAAGTVSEFVEPAFFAVSIDETASTLDVEEGDTVTVVAEVENTGEETATQDITLDIDGTVEDTASDISIDGGSTETVELQWETEGGDADDYTAEVASDDDSDTTSVTVVESVTDASLTGVVEEDSPGINYMEGVEVVLLEPGTDSVVTSDIVDDGGVYELADVDPGDYDVILQAAGLEPNYDIDEAGGDSTLSVTLEPGSNTQDMTVDWKSTMDLMVDGEAIVFRYGDPDEELELEMPGCEEQPNGSWELVEPETEDDVEFNYYPEECFQINDIGVDLVTGALDVEPGNVNFPITEIVFDDSDDDIHEDVEEVQVDFEWLVDDVAGAVDYTTGLLEVDLDARILVGGTVVASLFSYTVDFGHRDGYYDCQLTEAWGGDVWNPTTDDDDEQIGDYLHDPMRLRLTTGDSGPNGLSGEPYDADQALFMTLDNEVTVGELSEGEAYGQGHPAGTACGEDGLAEEDFAALLNEMLGLPAAVGDVLSEFDFLVTE